MARVLRVEPSEEIDVRRHRQHFQRKSGQGVPARRQRQHIALDVGLVVTALLAIGSFVQTIR
jgi:hypothetical protein